MRFATRSAVSTLVVLAAAGGTATAQDTRRVSVASWGAEGNRDSFSPALSQDGRLVAFHSEAADLVADDTNGVADVFVHDRVTGETTRVSVGAGGVEADDESGWPAISADGRIVAFQSDATNLVPGDTNRARDIFVHDRATGTTSRVSVSTEGAQSDGVCVDAAISADGSRVAFQAYDSKLVPGTINGWEVFVHDRASGTTRRACVSSEGVPGNFSSDSASLSSDGRLVAFHSNAENLVPGDTNGQVGDVFVHDLDTGVTTCASVAPDGSHGNDHSFDTVISADGRAVAFDSVATDLVPEGPDVGGVFVRDLETGRTSIVSVDSSGAPALGASFGQSISTNGRRVAFVSTASNLVPGDANGVTDVFVHDRATGETVRASVASDGAEANARSSRPAISGDGRFVAFDSPATNLVAGDANARTDVFLRRPADCGAGNVNAGIGPTANVLFVNDSAGGDERIVRLTLDEPLVVFMDAPPSATGLRAFALYGWRTLPNPWGETFPLPLAIGGTCLPTPFSGEGPRPIVIWNNTGFGAAGTPSLPSRPAPSVVLDLPRGLRREATAFLQGVIRDGGSPSGIAAVTNGLTIEIR